MGRPSLLIHEENSPRRGRARGALTASLAAGATVLLAGCSADARDTLQRGWLPSTKDTTDQTGRIMELWNGSWIAAWAVGFFVWGLILWVVVAYRRRRGETGLPAQVRYHIPLEICYTIVPLMMVGVLFFFTARDQAAIASVEAEPAHTVNAVGKQWSWDFNYVDEDVYETGVQAQLTGEEGVEEELPTLYLPVGERVRFVLTSRDVNHSFWIPAFLQKLDVIPGVQNQFQVVPQKIGDYRGKCAELCGEYHASMLFNVRVVSRADYEAYLQTLRDRGQTGQLGAELGRSDNADQDGAKTPGENSLEGGNVP